MNVNFKANEQAVKLPPLKPFQGDSQPVNPPKTGVGLVDKSIGLWTDTLKVKASAESYAGGLWRGLKYGAAAFATIAGADWFGKSIWNISKGTNTVGHMLGTLVKMPAKALAHEAAAFASVCRKDGISFGKWLWTSTVGLASKCVNKALKSKNTSMATKWVAPVVAALIFGYTTVRSVLNANEARAKIDHRYNVGHCDKA